MERQFATFYLGEGLFGIDVLLVREVNRNLDITAVDPAPDYVVGLMNLRGQIVTVVDLGVRLGLERRERTDSSACIVLKTSQELQRVIDEGLISDDTSKEIVGLSVDEVGDMVSVDAEDIESPPANMNGVAGRYLTGVIKLDGQLVATVKASEILND
jgi:purine-binding chemotaxis protein CheW